LTFLPDHKYRFPVHDLKSAEAMDTLKFKVKPMSVQIAGRHDLHFDFFSPQARAKVSISRQRSEALFDG
jgi:hypothetical protein